VLRIAPTFEVRNPQTLDEALALLGEHGSGARLIAGGTDLLPNIKHGLHAPTLLVNLKSVAGLDGVDLDGDILAFGALVPLERLASDPAIRAVLPALADAASQVAGPQHRRMGTLGGNVCLDTRCVYLNQTYFWRSALGFCIKKDGTECHVTKVGKKCVAAASNDTAPALTVLGASVELASPRGTRALGLDAFYLNDGVANTVIEADEVLTRILVPRPASDRRTAFQKLRIRGSIDFPMLNLALAFNLDDAGFLSAPDVVVGAIAARPRRVKRLPEGKLDAALVDAFCETAFKQVRPLTNINGDVAWRREMVPVLMRRAFESAAP